MRGRLWFAQLKPLRRVITLWHNTTSECRRASIHSTSDFFQIQTNRPGHKPLFSTRTEPKEPVHAVSGLLQGPLCSPPRNEVNRPLRCNSASIRGGVFVQHETWIVSQQSNFRLVRKHLPQRLCQYRTNSNKRNMSQDVGVPPLSNASFCFASTISVFSPIPAKIGNLDVLRHVSPKLSKLLQQHCMGPSCKPQ